MDAREVLAAGLRRDERQTEPPSGRFTAWSFEAADELLDALEAAGLRVCAEGQANLGGVTLTQREADRLGQLLGLIDTGTDLPDRHLVMRAADRVVTDELRDRLGWPVVDNETQTEFAARAGLSDEGEG